MFSPFDFAVWIAVTGLCYLVLNVWTRPARPSLLQRNKDVELSIQNRNLCESVQYGRELGESTKEEQTERQPERTGGTGNELVLVTEVDTDVPDTDVQPLTEPEAVTDDAPLAFPKIGEAA